MKNTFLFLLLLLSLYAHAQNKTILNLKYKESNESKFIQSFLDGNDLYILNFEKDIIVRDSSYFSFYKIDLNSKKIIKKLKINNGIFLKDAILKKDNRSISIINTSTLENEVVSYRISKDFRQQEKIILPIAEHINKYSLENFIVLKQNLLYQKLQPVKFDGIPIIRDNIFYSFENSYSQKNIKITRKSSSINYEKVYPYKSFSDYENDFREYTKYRKLNTFYFSENKTFVIPEVENYPINMDESYMLVFNIKNGTMEKVQKMNDLQEIKDCENIKTIDDRQLEMTSESGKKLIQFGVDNSENFCVCNSKVIDDNFHAVKITLYNSYKIYIGENTQTKSTQIIYKKNDW